MAEPALERAGPRLEALADPTRRGLLRAVAEAGSTTATELAAELPISRQAVAKHLALLERAGLVESVRSGRETRFEARAGALRDLAGWLVATSDAWDDRLERLTRHARARTARR
jgi:DNA-binding transcriptional ArsR family regulator